MVGLIKIWTRLDPVNHATVGPGSSQGRGNFCGCPCCDAQPFLKIRADQDVFLVVDLPGHARNHVSLWPGTARGTGRAVFGDRLWHDRAFLWAINQSVSSLSGATTARTTSWMMSVDDVQI